jgi:hypothetical protein
MKPSAAPSRAERQRIGPGGLPLLARFVERQLRPGFMARHSPTADLQQTENIRDRPHWTTLTANVRRFTVNRNNGRRKQANGVVP